MVQYVGCLLYAPVRKIGALEEAWELFTKLYSIILLVGDEGAQESKEEDKQTCRFQELQVAKFAH